MGDIVSAVSSIDLPLPDTSLEKSEIIRTTLDEGVGKNIKGSHKEKRKRERERRREIHKGKWLPY